MDAYASKRARFPIAGLRQRQKMAPNWNTEQLCTIAILTQKFKTPCKAADCQPTAVSADDSMMFAGSTWYLTQTFCSSPDAKGLAACSATWPLQVRPFQRGDFGAAVLIEDQSQEVFVLDNLVRIWCMSSDVSIVSSEKFSVCFMCVCFFLFCVSTTKHTLCYIFNFPPSKIIFKTRLLEKIHLFG